MIGCDCEWCSLPMDSLVKLLHQGRDAYNRGSGKDANPYIHGTAAYWNWEEGWNGAHRAANPEECECVSYPCAHHPKEK